MSDIKRRRSGDSEAVTVWSGDNEDAEQAQDAPSLSRSDRDITTDWLIHERDEPNDLSESHHNTPDTSSNNKKVQTHSSEQASRFWNPFSPSRKRFDNTEFTTKADQLSDPTPDSPNVDWLIAQIKNENLTQHTKSQAFDNLRQVPSDHLSLQNIFDLIEIGADSTNKQKRQIVSIIENLGETEFSHVSKQSQSDPDWDHIVEVSHSFFEEFEDYFDRMSGMVDDIDEFRRDMYIAALQKEL